MRIIVDTSIASENATIKDIGTKFEDLRTYTLNTIGTEVVDIYLDREGFYEYLLMLELYYSNEKEKLYLLTAVEYEGEIYFESTELNSIDELRDKLEFDVVDIDKITFEVSLEINKIYREG